MINNIKKLEINIMNYQIIKIKTYKIKFIKIMQLN